MAEHASRVIGKSTKRIERRAFVRLTSDLAAQCHQAGHAQLVSWPGYVRNISRGGLGLVLRHRFRPGTFLTVELRQRAGAPLHVVRVRVVRVSAILDQGSHGWLLGCTFDEPLDDEAWQALT